MTTSLSDRNNGSEHAQLVEAVAELDLVEKLVLWMARNRRSAPQMAVLFLLRETPHCMTALADRMGRSTAALTGTVDRLELADMVVRTPSTSDRRQIECSLTRRGEALVDSLYGELVDGQADQQLPG